MRGVRHTLATLMDRVEPEPNTGCWLWPGAWSNGGYGFVKMTVNGKAIQHYAHRLFYELFVGPIREGLQIDHKCRVRCCVNPSHLEAVTPRENQMRSPISPVAINARKRKCKCGAEYRLSQWKCGTRRWCPSCVHKNGARNYALKKSRLKSVDDDRS